MTQTPPTAPIAWHCLLGEVLEKLLSPVGLLVYTELAVMNKPPKADILIIRREQAHWTEPQRQRLQRQTQEYKAKLCRVDKASLCTPGKVSRPHSQAFITAIGIPGCRRFCYYHSMNCPMPHTMRLSSVLPVNCGPNAKPLKCYGT